LILIQLPQRLKHCATQNRAWNEFFNSLPGRRILAHVLNRQWRKSALAKQTACVDIIDQGGK